MELNLRTDASGTLIEHVSPELVMAYFEEVSPRSLAQQLVGLLLLLLKLLKHGA